MYPKLLEEDAVFQTKKNVITILNSKKNFTHISGTFLVSVALYWTCRQDSCHSSASLLFRHPANCKWSEVGLESNEM